MYSVVPVLLVARQFSRNDQLHANKKMFLVDKHNFATNVYFRKVYLLSKFFASGKMGSAQKMLIKINPSLLQNLKTFLFNVYVYSDPNMNHLFVNIYKIFYVMNHSTSFALRIFYFFSNLRVLSYYCTFQGLLSN